MGVTLDQNTVGIVVNLKNTVQNQNAARAQKEKSIFRDFWVKLWERPEVAPRPPGGSRKRSQRPQDLFKTRLFYKTEEVLGLDFYPKARQEQRYNIDAQRYAHNTRGYPN